MRKKERKEVIQQTLKQGAKREFSLELSRFIPHVVAVFPTSGGIRGELPADNPTEYCVFL